MLISEYYILKREQPMDDKSELKQDIKELRDQFHSIDKSLESFRATSNAQHESIERLLKENISKDDAMLKEHDTRLDKVEDDITKIKTEGENRKKNHNILLGAGTIAATIVAVIIGIIIDHYLLQ